MRPARACAVVLGAIVALAACATVPGTGRRQLMLTSPAEESRMGLEASRQILAQERRTRDPAVVALVERVGRRIAAVAPTRGFQWTYTVLDSAEPNAFCLPGGQVFVYTGILQHCGSEAGLATVVGHEIAHAVARHGGERMSQGLLAQIGGSMVAVALAGAGAEPTTANMILTAYGAGAQLGILLPYSRTHELEADRLGLEYMARAGYDPSEAVAFWRRFAASKPRQGNSFFSTHPSSAERQAQLAAMLPGALALYAQSPRYGRGALLVARPR